MRSVFARVGLLTLVLGLCGVSCGGAQTRLALFSTDWEDDGGASIGRVWQRVGSTPAGPSADVVVGVAGGGDKVVGLPLSSTGRSRWTFGHSLDVRPVVTGRAVVGSGGGETFALDAESGTVLWRRATPGQTLLGAGDDGAITVATLRNAAGGSVLLAVAHDGTLVRQIETAKSLGTPAILAKMAFVPWADQYVSVIDLDSGDEVARATMRSEISRAWVESGSLWFGEVSFIRFDEHIIDSSRGRASTVSLPIRELAGMPKLMAPGSAPTPPLATAEDKARLYARPVASSAGAAIEDGRWYATYFRVAMAFEAGEQGKGDKQSSGGKLTWVHLHGSDFLGGAATPGGVVLCDEKGKVTALDVSTGGTLSEADLGEPVKSCVVHIDGQRVVGAPTDTKPLAAQLSEAVLADDPQLVVAQRLLLRELAAMSDETGTKALVDLASDVRTSPPLLADARTALANRRNGAAYMEAALSRHYDFLRDVLRPPPVGPMSQALGAMKDKAAAPLLAAHLLDPADTNDDVMRAAAALAVVAGPNELPALRQFFGMYRATADDDDIAAAVVSVGRALMSVDERSGQAMVEAAAADASTVPYARERLKALASAAKQGSPAGTSEKGSEKKGK